jgi:PRC-barrel domain
LDGEIGHIEDFVVDDETWVIRYLVVDTKNWLPGKRVLIDRISWEESKVFLTLTLDKIREAPEFTKDTLITREY